MYTGDDFGLYTNPPVFASRGKGSFSASKRLVFERMSQVANRAVEALTKLITGVPKASLGDALPLLESKLGSVHPALRKAFSNLYGYTNDAQGIRHALLGESDLDIEDAKFMLIACSAFRNYLVAKADKAKIKLSPSKKASKKRV